MKQRDISSIRLIRHYVARDFTITDWNGLEYYFNELLNRPVLSVNELEKWLIDRGELESVCEEEQAWRYIKMTCDTQNTEIKAKYEFFIEHISPKISLFSNKLDKKMVDNPFFQQLNNQYYFVFKRDISMRMKIFHEKNVPIMAEIEKEQSQYGQISSQMTIMFDDKELTMQQASNYLKKTDRSVREQVFMLMANRRLEDKEKLNELMGTLASKRQQLALNSGYKNFRDYQFDKLCRFDYTIQDCMDFHSAIASEVIPLIGKMQDKRAQSLGIAPLKPWDMLVDPDKKEALRPFNTIDELVDKTISCFSEIDPLFADNIQIMKEIGHLDLESRKGKAPGGYNYPLYESNIPFIFMNASGNLRDLETMHHEGGHAIHSFLSKDIQLVHYKDTPAEVAELASMSMELIAMEYWDVFFEDPEDLKRAKRTKLEDLIEILPWIAQVDKFQHWLYTHPDHSASERMDEWSKINQEFSTGKIDISGLENYQRIVWQKQLHIFEIPFYYIEYGIAQLGAIAIWKNFRNNPKQTIEQYKKALSLGYTKPIPEIYKTAGIEFNFSKEYIASLMQFVNEEIDKLYR